MINTEIVTVHVPFHIRKRGGRKEMILPDAALTKHRHVDNTLIKGLARAFRWKRMLNTGACPTFFKFHFTIPIFCIRSPLSWRVSLNAPRKVVLFNSWDFSLFPSTNLHKFPP